MNTRNIGSDMKPSIMACLLLAAAACVNANTTYSLPQSNGDDGSLPQAAPTRDAGSLQNAFPERGDAPDASLQNAFPERGDAPDASRSSQDLWDWYVPERLRRSTKRDQDDASPGQERTRCRCSRATRTGGCGSRGSRRVPRSTYT
jgi:hypothetical protein